MKLLITGGEGQIAFDLKRCALVPFVAPNHLELDITNADAVQNYLEKFQPDVVINTAAYTAVDLAEKESEKSFLVNRDGAKNVAIACQKIKCPLIHLSTDYVFDGKKELPYHEEDEAQPLSVYGQSKLAGELAVQEACDRYIILRVSAVFGEQGNNFVKTILRLASEREELRIVNDQWTCPTPSRAIAETILKLCDAIKKNPSWGVYHYSGMPGMNWFEFAKKIISHAGNRSSLKVKTILPVTAKEFNAPALRPKNSMLDCTKLRIRFGITQPEWEEFL